MLYLMSKQFNHQLQFFIKFSVKGISLFYIFLTTIITLKILTGIILRVVRASKKTHKFTITKINLLMLF
jgi:hypothetical protein